MNVLNNQNFFDIQRSVFVYLRMYLFDDIILINTTTTTKHQQQQKENMLNSRPVLDSLRPSILFCLHLDSFNKDENQQQKF